MLQPVRPDTPAFETFVEALTTAGLPTSDLDQDAAEYFALDEGAYGGVAVYGTDGLLRSLVVPASKRRRGTGSTLLEQLLEHARSAGVLDVWLLTTSAEAFFARHGFEETERANAPVVIAGTSQFKDLCPASATLMHKRIG